MEVVKRLIDDGATVRIVVRSQDNSALMQQKGVQLIPGSVTDLPFMESVCKGAHGIFHLAGVVDHSSTIL